MRLHRKVIAALGATLVILGVVGSIAYLSVSRLVETSGTVWRTHQVLRLIEVTYSAIADAETGSRGYLLTGDTSYLEPYRAATVAIDDNLAALRQLTSSSPRQRAQLEQLDPLIQRRLAVMQRAVVLRREQGFEAALAAVRTGRGKALMDSVRQEINRLEASEQTLLSARSDAEAVSVRRLGTALGAALFLAVVISVVAAVIVRRDLALRTAAERGLREAKDAAEGANQAKSQFLARMSHELRTPLNSVIGFSNVLLRKQDSARTPDERLYLERIRDNGMHLLHLIDDLLDVARIDVGRLRIERRPVELGALVRGVVGGFEEEARRRELALTCDIPEDLMWIESDPTRLRQVLVNLVGNAVKFTERGSVHVRITAWTPDNALGRSGDHLRLDVIDTGIGIAADRQPAIFDPFEQAETGTARKYGGTGLGLAICRSLCELMGARLEVQSTLGEGSTFSVMFPTSRQQPTQADAAMTVQV
ncbi:MAG: CHASE3 domain-containing protein [Gemmatimonadota bacterium]